MIQPIGVSARGELKKLILSTFCCCLIKYKNVRQAPIKFKWLLSASRFIRFLFYPDLPLFLSTQSEFFARLASQRI